MTLLHDDPESVLRQSAAQWVVRLRGPDAEEADWLAFEAWLADTPGSRGAYDEAAALWTELERATPDLKSLLGKRSSVIRLADRRPVGRVLAWTGVGAAIAAAAAIAVMIFALPQRGAPGPAPLLYATAKGERRTVVLPDGSRVDLNGGSRMLVSFGGHDRKVTLTDAEASFAVTHDPEHPFLVTAGDRTVRVVGTQFDVLHHDGRIAVVVRQGLVEVDNDAGGAVRLGPGRRLRATEGALAAVVDTVTPQEAEGWRAGRLVYRDRPLSEVVSDLGRYFVGPIRLEGEHTGSLRFSGVLVVDNEDEIISRIRDLLPVSVKRVNGATIIRASEEGR